MIWDDRLCKYARLSQQELKNLENPFQEGYLPKSRPNKQENPFYKEILQTIFRTGRTIRLNQTSIEKNLFFIPQVFRARRVNQLPKILHKNLKRTAIFHDANVLRDPQNTPSARVQNFEKYLSVISNFDRISCVSVESMDIFKETLNKRKSTQNQSSPTASRKK